MKVTVLYNLPGTSTSQDITESEDDTYLSAKAVCEALETLGHDVDVLGITRDDIKKIKNVKSDFVFNLVEWSGRDSLDGINVTRELEKSGIPFSGSGAYGYGLSCDKMVMKQEMIKNNIPTPPYRIVEGGKLKVENFDLKFPVIVKPIAEHCGIGVGQDSLCNNIEELKAKVKDLTKKYDQSVLVEEFIDGRELHVTVLEKHGQPWVLPAAEVAFKKQEGFAPILSYDGKWREDSSEYGLSECIDAVLDEKLKVEVERVATLAYNKLGGRDYPRLDMRIRNGKVYVLEINNNPGMGFDTESGIGRSARMVGFDTFAKLLDHIITNAGLRFAHSYDTATV